MNISPHLLIDTVILSDALIITSALRSEGNSSRKEKENKWLPKKMKKISKNLNYIKYGTF